MNSHNKKSATLIFQSDWLGSSPYFYNSKTGTHSACINQVIDHNDLEFDESGLKAYLFCGYSICGRTPVKNVHFLLPHTQLWAEPGGSLYTQELPDPAEGFLDYKLSEDDIFDMLRSKIQTWEETQADTIVIPTSGGYDSRLLNYMVKDKTRIRSISYGISVPQSKSYEVVYPRELAKILGTQWQQIELGKFHKYFSDWYGLYGVSTHAHGMYHFEFYLKYLQDNMPTSLLTGIIGDAWAKLEQRPLSNAGDVYELMLAHNIHVPHSFLNFCIPELFEEYYNNKKMVLDDPRLRVVETMRFKMLLLSYLVRLPESLGFSTYGPFLDIDLAMAMLNLPPERRKNRIWQQEFMAKKKIDIENWEIPVDRSNYLDMFAFTAHPVPRITPPDKMTDFFAVAPERHVKEFLSRKNRLLISISLKYKDKPSPLFEYLCDKGWIKNFAKGSYSEFVDNYSMYTVLYPLYELCRKAVCIC